MKNIFLILHVKTTSSQCRDVNKGRTRNDPVLFTCNVEKHQNVRWIFISLAVTSKQNINHREILFFSLFTTHTTISQEKSVYIEKSNNCCPWKPLKIFVPHFSSVLIVILKKCWEKHSNKWKSKYFINRHSNLRLAGNEEGRSSLSFRYISVSLYKSTHTNIHAHSSMWEDAYKQCSTLNFLFLHRFCVIRETRLIKIVTYFFERLTKILREKCVEQRVDAWWCIGQYMCHDLQ